MAKAVDSQVSMWPTRHERPTGDIALIAEIVRGSPKLDAACKRADPLIFDTVYDDDVAVAAGICRRCAVRLRCREWALKSVDDIEGTVGGLVFYRGAVYEPAQWLAL